MNPPGQDPPPRPPTRMFSLAGTRFDPTVTSNITFIVLLSYVVLLIAFTVISGLSAVKGAAEDKWFDLTKTGFTTLGSALTLILGYYFGQKQATKELEREKDESIEQVQKDEAEKRMGLVAKLKEQATSNQPDSLAEIDPARRQTGRPPKQL